MSNKVLIVTHSSDLHADLVVERMLARDHQPFRIDLDAFPRDYQLSQTFVNGCMSTQMRRCPDGEWLDLARVGAVWIRKAANYAFLSEDLSLQERAYAKLETEQALFGVLYTLDCYWMSHPAALRASQWKGEQLQRAMRMGFRIPASIVTNCAERVRAFRRAIGGQMIFKTMSTPTLAAEDVDGAERISDGVLTTLVDDAMMENLDAVGELTCHFQEYIPKQYELRVTVIGERVFAARIHSQDDRRSAIDSRDMAADVRYAAHVLPREIEQRCREFVHSYGLNYGALDLIVTPEGEFVFLENNPAGQFLYIEELVPELDMLDTIATTLIKEATCRK
ncbi:MAG: hypothetical protein V4633_16460 [Pseudomonadota bacterium]